MNSLIHRRREEARASLLGQAVDNVVESQLKAEVEQSARVYVGSILC